MKDSEIVERLQFLLKIGDAPIGKGFGVVIDKQDIHETLALIKRQRAEIERLKKQLDCKCDRCIARDKADAIRWFTNSLNGRINPLSAYNGAAIRKFVDSMAEDCISIVKGMVGDDNGNL